MGLTGSEGFFMLFVVLFLALFVLKLLNVLAAGRLYGKLMVFASFIGGLLFFGLLLIINMAAASLLLSVLFGVARWLFGLFVVFFVAELFFMMAEPVVSRSRNMGRLASEDKEFSVWRL